MKKCPTCEKTFEDSMRFCQIDGTPLVADDEPAFDPYATIVGKPGEIKVPEETPATAEAAMPEAEPAAASEGEAKPAGAPSEADSTAHKTAGSIPIGAPQDILDLPEADPLKTMYVSESEMQAALSEGSQDKEPEIVEIPPIEDKADSPAAETIESEPPKFEEPNVPTPSFGASTPPPSPFDTPSAHRPEPAKPSFPEPAPAPPVFDEPAQPAFDEAATIIQPPIASSYETPPAPVAGWSPPPAPDVSWQNQQIGSNTPFQPPPGAAGAAQSKTLAIVSLVTGILGLLCCSSIFIVGLTGVITGFMAMSKAGNNPAEYGGKGLAIAGIITGGLSLLIGVVYWVLVAGGLITLPF